MLNVIEWKDGDYIVYEEDDPIYVFNVTQGLEAFEWITGEKFRTILSHGTVTISEEVRELLTKARIRTEENDDGDIPTIDRKERKREYVFLYQSVENPSRLAGVTVAKYEKYLAYRFIRDMSREMSRYRDPYVKVALWFTLELNRAREKGLMEWFRQGKIKTSIDREEDQEWLRDNGVFLKPGKVVKAIAAIESDYSTFCGYLQDILNETLNGWENIRVSDTPSEVYTMGGNFTSCMRAEGADFFKIYDDVKNCRIAYIKENGYLHARALLWDNVVNTDTDEVLKIMDRIYFEDNAYLANMTVWAKRNGYVRKTKQALDVHTYIRPDETRFEMKRASVEAGFTFEWDMYQNVPYVDTFSYAYEDGSKLHTWPAERGNYVDMRSTNGDGEFLTGGSRLSCDACGCRLTEDNYWSAEGDDYIYCEDCFTNRYTRCEDCEEWIPNDYIREVEVDGAYGYYCNRCLEEYTWEEWSDAYWSDGYLITYINEDGEKDWCSTYRRDEDRSLFVCHDCNRVMHVDNLNNEMSDRLGYPVCVDCEEEIEEENDEAAE